MRTIIKGQVVYLDKKDEHFLHEYPWAISSSGYVYCKKYTGRVNGKDVQKCYFLHKLINPNKEQVDHINGNTLDNRRDNLRSCTPSENMWNSQKPKNNTSGYKGVSHFKGKWMALICKDYKRIYLGCYDTPMEAAKVYDEKAVELFGEFAKLNLGVER